MRSIRQLPRSQLRASAFLNQFCECLTVKVQSQRRPRPIRGYLLNWLLQVPTRAKLTTASSST